MKCKHWKIWLSMAMTLIMLSGCSFLNSTPQEVTDMIAESEEITEKEETKENEKKDQDKLEVEFVKFFNQFYSIPTSEIINLNAYPTIPNDNYSEVFKRFSESSLSLMEKYMTPELEKNLKKNYFQTDIHFPRFLLINKNVIINYNKVEGLEYNLINQEDIKDGKDKIYTYLINVKVKANTIPLQRFNELFTYNVNSNYYSLANASTIIEESEKDEIMLECNYVAKIQEKNNKISFYSLKEHGEKAIPEDERRSLLNSSFVKRVNYIEKPLTADSLLIREFIHKFFNMDKDDYLYYEYAFDTNYEIFSQSLADLAIRDYFAPKEEHFRSQYPKMIVPTKDDIIALSVNKEDVKIEVHSIASRGGRVYVVDIPAVAELSDYSKEDLEYRYYMLVEDIEEEGPKITKIQYIFISRHFPETKNIVTDPFEEDSNNVTTEETNESGGLEEAEEALEDF